MAFFYRDNFPAIVRCYAHVCQRIADGTAWLEPPAAAASILPAGSRPPSDAAAAAQPAAADAAASKQPGGSKPLSRSSSIELSRQGLSRSGSIELSRQNLSRTCSIDALNPLGMSAAAAAGRAVCIDEEIFGATTQILAEGFLRIPANQLLDVDYQQTASDVSGLIAITNSFLSQPWKKWLYLGIPNLCEVCFSLVAGGALVYTCGWGGCTCQWGVSLDGFLAGHVVVGSRYGLAGT